MTANPPCRDQRLRSSEPAIAIAAPPLPDYERNATAAGVRRRHRRAIPSHPQLAASSSQTNPAARGEEFCVCGVGGPVRFDEQHLA
jgi:hypothetical protein